MSKRGKKYNKAAESVQKETALVVGDALQKVKDLSFAKFDESVDVAVNLGIDATKGEQTVRSSVTLPHGRGKKVRVIVFAKGEHAEDAQKAGADEVGFEDLIEKIKGGWLEFDYAVATPDVMGKVGVLAKTLGPRGLLPNKKVGTVTFDVGKVVLELKKGRAFFKNDKSGIVHFCIGKVSFDRDQLKENLDSFVRAVAASRPATAKGKYIKKLTVSSTMGVSLLVDTDELLRSL